MEASGPTRLLNTYNYISREQAEDLTPSRRDGIDAVKELQCRRGYVSMIQEAGMKLAIPQWAISTAVLFCHRYFAVKSMKRNERFLVAAACVFLASKVEESPRPLLKVADTFDCIKATKTHQIPAFTNPASDENTARRKKHLEALGETILVAERAVLYMLGFGLNISHPYGALLEQCKKLELLQQKEGSPHADLMQISWNLLNDSLRTTLCLQYAPGDLANAMLFLAAEIAGVELPLPKGCNIYDFFGMPPGKLQDITSQMLGLYGTTQKTYFKKQPLEQLQLQQQQQQQHQLLLQGPVKQEFKQDVKPEPKQEAPPRSSGASLYPTPHPAAAAWLKPAAARAPPPPGPLWEEDGTESLTISPEDGPAAAPGGTHKRPSSSLDYNAPTWQGDAGEDGELGLPHKAPRTG